MNKEGSEIAGTFTQAGTPFQLIFRKAGLVQSTTAVKRGRIALKPCNDPTLTSDALCVKYECLKIVPRVLAPYRLKCNFASREESKGGSDPLSIWREVQVAATVYATEKFIDNLRRNRDVVLVDQRGTGDSNLLNCAFSGGRDDMRPYFSEPFPVEKFEPVELSSRRSPI
jgi:hypothetical protein